MCSSLKTWVVFLSTGTLLFITCTGVLAQEKLIAKQADASPSPLSELLSTPAPLPRGPVHEAFAQPVKLTVKSGVVVQQRPPAAVKEIPNDNRPPGEDVEWVDGYWSWNDRAEKYVWVSGLWRKTPPGRRWEPGTWVKLVDGYIWVAGEWMPDESKEKFASVNKPPPESLESGPNQPRPMTNTFWLPGNWEQAQEKKIVAAKTEVEGPIATANTSATNTSATNIATSDLTASEAAGSSAATQTNEARNFSLIKAAPTEGEQNGYSWRPGFWTVARDNWVWVPDHYTWTPDGCRKVEGYWDFPWSVRGNLNACCGQPTDTYSPASIDTSDQFTRLWTHSNTGQYYYGNYYEEDPGNLVPWHQYHLQDSGYDPLYTYYSTTFGPKVGQDFGTYLNSRYAYNQKVLCPSCKTSITGIGGTGRRPVARAAAVAAPIAAAAAIAGGSGSSAVAAATGSAVSAATGGTSAANAATSAATGSATAGGTTPAAQAAAASPSTPTAAATTPNNAAQAVANQAQQAAGNLQNNLPGQGGGGAEAGGESAAADASGGSASDAGAASGGGEAAGGGGAEAGGGGGSAPSTPGKE